MLSYSLILHLKIFQVGLIADFETGIQNYSVSWGSKQKFKIIFFLLMPNPRQDNILKKYLFLPLKHKPP
jgi:hypothetical protein